MKSPRFVARSVSEPTHCERQAEANVVMEKDIAFHTKRPMRFSESAELLRTSIPKELQLLALSRSSSAL